MRRTLLLVISFLCASVVSYADVLIPVKTDKGLWGYSYASNLRHLVIDPIYEDAMPFFNGYAVVKLNDSYGLVNDSGSIVVNPVYSSLEYDKAGDYYKGGYANSSAVDMIRFKDGGLEITTIERLVAKTVEGGYSAVIVDDTLQIIDRKGNFVLDSLEQLPAEGMYKGKNVLTSETWVIRIDDSSKMSIYPFAELINDSGLLIGRQRDSDSGYGLLDSAYIFIIPQYPSMQVFGGKYVVACSGGKYDIYLSDASSLFEGVENFYSNGDELHFSLPGSGFSFSIDAADSSIYLEKDGFRTKMDSFEGGLNITDRGLCMWTKPNGTIGVANQDGKLIWGDDVTGVTCLGDSKRLFVITNASYDSPRLANSLGTVYDVKFDEIRRERRHSDCYVLSGGEDDRIMYILNDHPCILSSFNYNDFCSFKDLDTGKYGRLNENLELIEAADLDIEPKATQGCRWIDYDGDYMLEGVDIYGRYLVNEFRLRPYSRNSGHGTFVNVDGYYSPEGAMAAYLDKDYDEVYNFTYKRKGKYIYLNDDDGYKLEIDANNQGLIVRGYKNKRLLYALSGSTYTPPVSCSESSELPDNWRCTLTGPLEAASVFPYEIQELSNPSSDSSENDFKPISSFSNGSTLVNIFAQRGIKERFSEDDLSEVDISIGSQKQTMHGSLILAPGEYDLSYSSCRYKPYKTTIKVFPDMPAVSTKLLSQFQQKTSLYIGADYEYKDLKALNINAGMNLGFLNLEFFFSKLTDRALDYPGAVFGFKAGLNFVIGSRLRLVPQVGLGDGSLDDYSVLFVDRSFDDFSILVSDIRLEFALTRWLCVYGAAFNNWLLDDISFPDGYPYTQFNTSGDFKPRISVGVNLVIQ